MKEMLHNTMKYSMAMLNSSTFIAYIKFRWSRNQLVGPASKGLKELLTKKRNLQKLRI